MSKPNILLLTNEKFSGDSAGQIDGYKILVNSGELGSVTSVSHNLENVDNLSQILRALETVNYDLLVIWSPNTFPKYEEDFAKILQLNNARPIVYWEGDPWGVSGSFGLKGRKPPTSQMAWWMQHSDYVFTIAGFPQAHEFVRIGAKLVFQTIHTYCHLKFHHEEKNEPQPFFEYDLSMMSRNLSRIPFLTGVPGSSKRFFLVKQIRSLPEIDFRLFGSQWPSHWSKGLLEYDDVVKEMRKSRFNVNWDNFDYYHDYASDRLPLAMISGRPSFSTLHPGMNWAPRQDLGVNLFEEPKKLIDELLNNLSRNPEETHLLGLAGHQWARHRISHREGARYILSKVCGITPPPADPWSALPAPITSNSSINNR
jgi:hypothetical protein